MTPLGVFLQCLNTCLEAQYALSFLCPACADCRGMNDKAIGIHIVFDGGSGGSS
jgi:hypothetical protein